MASQGVAILIQLASVPIFLTAWGATLYGQWLILSAAPSYLSLADFGFGTAACNLMAIRLARGDESGARRAFAAALALTLVSVVFFGCLLMLVVGLLPHWMLIHGAKVASADATIVVVALGIAVLLSMVRTTFYSVLYAEGRYPSGLFFLAVCRLFEFVASSTIALSGLSLGASALGVLGVGTVTTSLYAVYIFSTTKTFRIGLRDWRFAEFKSMAGPSLAFLMFPLSNAINFQGVIIVIGMLFSPAYVVAFATARSLSRFAVLPVRAFLEALRPELSRLYGLGDISALSGFVARTSRLSQWGALTVIFVICLFGEEVLTLWTRGFVNVSWFVLFFLLMSAYSQAIYYPWYLTSCASNKHQFIAALSLFMNVILIGVILSLGAKFIVGPAVAIAIGDFVFGVGCLLAAARLLGERPGSIALSAFHSPVEDVCATFRGIGRVVSRARPAAR